MKQTAETYGAVLHTDLCQLTEHLSALQLCDLLCHQNSYTTELSKDTLWDTQAAGNGKPHQGMERTACEMAEDRAAIWELKMERIETHSCQGTGERAGHKSQSKQALWTWTQPEASVLCSQQTTLKATKSHFTSLPNLSRPHIPASTAAPAAETPARFLSPSPAREEQGPRNCYSFCY